jgi:hypothetical protein
VWSVSHAPSGIRQSNWAADYALVAVTFCQVNTGSRKMKKDVDYFIFIFSFCGNIKSGQVDLNTFFKLPSPTR